MTFWNNWKWSLFSRAYNYKWRDLEAWIWSGNQEPEYGVVAHCNLNKKKNEKVENQMRPDFFFQGQGTWKSSKNGQSCEIKPSRYITIMHLVTQQFQQTTFWLVKTLLWFLRLTWILVTFSFNWDWKSTLKELILRYSKTFIRLQLNSWGLPQYQSSKTATRIGRTVSSAVWLQMNVILQIACTMWELCGQNCYWKSCYVLFYIFTKFITSVHLKLQTKFLKISEIYIDFRCFEGLNIFFYSVQYK